jgi:hypothetical protein
MLAVPKSGVYRSVNKHTSRLDLVTDWVEGAALFQEQTELSAADVLDILMEEGIYESQTFAWEFIEDVWGELGLRQKLLGAGFPLEVGTTRITRRFEWRDVPGHSFCLALSLALAYPKWAGSFGKDFTEQGELFELLTLEAMKAEFSGWSFHLTGWSRSSSLKISDVAPKVAELLGEQLSDVKRWVAETANEAGLDLLCFRPFPDQRIAIPVLLMQCASGRDWQDKLKTPDIDVWSKLVLFGSRPKAGFATPFALRDDVFIQSTAVINGILLDRYRLLSPARGKPDWVGEPLKTKLISWLSPRIASLLSADL